MKFIALKDNVKDNILLAEKSVGKRVTLPVLSSILFSAEKGKITLTATNLETGVEIRVGGKIEKEGKIAIPARVVGSYVSFVDGDQITFFASGDNLEIMSPKGKTVIRGYPAADFPLLPRLEIQKITSVPAAPLYQALVRVLPAVALSDIKPEIASILFSFTSPVLTVVATDSFRLSEQKIQNIQANNQELFLLPARSATDLIRFLDKEQEDVEIQKGNGQIVFSTSRFRMVSRLTEGVFPEYTRILPTSFTTEVIVDRKALVDALRIAGLFVGKLYDVTFRVNSDDHTLHIEAANTDVGENTAYIDADTRGESLGIRFNYKYIMDGLSQITEKDLFLGFTSVNGPLLMRNKDEKKFLYLVMPMKV